MNWDAISAVSETISSIAVIISLLYLAQQIRHSNKLSHSQTRTDLRQYGNAEVETLIEHPEIWLMMWKDKLSPEEQSRIHWFLIRAMRFREFIWRQHKMGLLDKVTYESYIGVVAQTLSTERSKVWWNSYKHSGIFDPEFIELVEDILAKNPGFDLKQHLESL